MSVAHDPDQLLNLDLVELSKGCNRCAELAKLAYYDQLTGLANRISFKIKLDHAISIAAREGSRFAVLFLDLDNFKSVNDSLGHDAGDSLLQQTARRLRSLLRANDLIARYGGDEFAILLEDSSLCPFSLADRIAAAMRETPFFLRSAEIFVTASVGVATYPLDATTYSDLLRRADVAMYAHKGNHSLLKVGS